MAAFLGRKVIISASIQEGFRPGHSTIWTTSLVLNDIYIYTSLNDNNVTYAVFIDAMKAFDMVNYEILLNFFRK